MLISIMSIDTEWFSAYPTHRVIPGNGAAAAPVTAWLNRWMAMLFGKNPCTRREDSPPLA